jgi:hypothetical protein
VAGGFYLRAVPPVLFEGALAAVLRRRPASLFLHPWECVPEVPRVPLGAVDAFITYHNLADVPRRLERLLDRHSCVPMIDILEQGGHLRRAA